MKMYLQRANLYVQLKELQKALDDYNNIISLEPTNGLAYYKKAAVYEGMGEFRFAWNNLSTAKSLGYPVKEEDIAYLKSLVK